MDIRRAAASVRLILPSASRQPRRLNRISIRISDSDPAEGAEREELSEEEQARRPRKAKREAKREARLEARRRKSGESGGDEGESGDEDPPIWNLNDRTNRRAEKILQEENAPCNGSEDKPCAE